MLNDSVTVITGGAGLLGRAFAKGIAEAGGRAVIADIDAKAARKCAAELGEECGAPERMLAVRMDITDKDSINGALEEILERWGRVDALVNNAYPRNANYGRSFFEVEYEDFVQNVGLNLGGYFVTSQQFARHFQKQKRGNIVNVASIYGVIAPRFEIYDGTPMTMPVEYAAIKSALIHLTRYMAKYLGGSGIRVNALSPGGIFDNQPEAFVEAYNRHCASRGMLAPEEVAGTLVYLLSDLSRHVTGQNIVVDDGFTL
ncbi:oxidoreductase [Hydrogenimonas sp.]